MNRPSNRYQIGRVWAVCLVVDCRLLILVSKVRKGRDQRQTSSRLERERRQQRGQDHLPDDRLWSGVQCSMSQWQWDVVQSITANLAARLEVRDTRVDGTDGDAGEPAKLDEGDGEEAEEGSCHHDGDGRT